MAKTVDSAVAEVVQSTEQEDKRSAALFKATGLDKMTAEQREITLAISKRYDLDLLLKHLVLVDGKPFVTRDGNLHIAHRSGQLDGIEVTDPKLMDLEGQGKFWVARCSVYRRDMSRPFVYSGRYPAKGGNNRFAPEMAVKVAESMALRRAFDISAPSIEERWDREDVGPAEPVPTITDSIAAAQARVTTSGPVVSGASGQGEVSTLPPADHAGARAATPDPQPGNADQGNPTPAPTEEWSREERCQTFDKDHGRCVSDAGHKGPHTDSVGEDWK